MHNGTLVIFLNKKRTVNKRKIEKEVRTEIPYTECISIGETEEEIKRFFNPTRVYKEYKGEKYHIKDIEILIKQIGTKTNYEL